MGEDPRELLLNNDNSFVVICDYLLSEGYECPSVISFFGASGFTLNPQLSDHNLSLRSVANLIVFQEPKQSTSKGAHNAYNGDNLDVLGKEDTNKKFRN